MLSTMGQEMIYVNYDEHLPLYTVGRAWLAGRKMHEASSGGTLHATADQVVLASRPHGNAQKWAASLGGAHQPLGMASFESLRSTPSMNSNIPVDNAVEPRVEIYGRSCRSIRKHRRDNAIFLRGLPENHSHEPPIHVLGSRPRCPSVSGQISRREMQNLLSLQRRKR